MTTRNTKRTLVASLLSLVLCLAMLVGTTFAWFTDSVKSGSNKIVAGNLDIELYHGADEKVTGETKLFTPADGFQWEPGAVLYENFTVKNEGSLALKYEFSLLINSYNTVADSEKSLLDVLKVAVVKNSAPIEGREDIADLTFAPLAAFTKSGNLTAGASDTYSVVIYWEPSAADDDYNLKNGAQSSDGAPLFVDLGVRLEATQDTVESDGFNDQYDKDAGFVSSYVSNEAELNAAIAAGGYISLTQDIAISEAIDWKDVPAFELNGNGFSLTAAEDFRANSTYGRWDLMKIETENAVTLKNLRLEHRALTQTAGTFHTLDIYASPDVTLENVTLIRDFDSVKGGAPLVLSQSGVTVKGGFCVVAGGSAWGAVNVDSSTLNIADAEVVLSGAKNFIYTENSGVVVYDEAEWVKEGTESSYLLTKAAANVDGVPYKSLNDAIAALSDGSTLTFAPGTYHDVTIAGKNNITIKGSESVVLDGILTVSGDGVTLDGIHLDYQGEDKPNPAYGHIVIYGNNYTIKNCNFVAKYNPDDPQAIGQNFGMVRVDYGTNGIIENCTFKTNTMGLFPAMKTGKITGCTFEPIDERRSLAINCTDMWGVEISNNTFKGVRILTNGNEETFAKNKFIGYSGTIFVESFISDGVQIDLSGSYFGENPDFSRLIGDGEKVKVDRYYTDEAMTNLQDR